MFIGRDFELKTLEESYRNQDRNLVVMYGRRRIGKSHLISHFIKGKKSFVFEGIEGAKTIDQIDLFVNALRNQAKNFTVPEAKYTTWVAAFDLLDNYLQTTKGKTVIVFDEFQWMAQQKTLLVSLLKNYFDNKWTKHKIMLILCGSISSFMVSKVIHSKALYGRVNLELQIKGFSPLEAKEFLTKQRGAVKLKDEEILKYLMVLGPVPKYLAEIRTSDSFSKNIDRLCFQKSGFLFQEFEKIFYSQFKEPRIYRLITEQISKMPLTLKEIGDWVEIPSGGGLKSYIDNLVTSDFISQNRVLNKNGNAKLVKYRICDSFLNFYFKYMKSTVSNLLNHKSSGYFQRTIETKYSPWLGIAFENFCISNANLIASILGINGEVVGFGPLIYRDTPGVQVDLAFLSTQNTLTLCEIKYWNKPIGTEIIPEIKKKIALVKEKFSSKNRIEVVLIAPFGISKDLDNVKYFNQVVTLSDIFTTQIN